jgi:two-component system chemotaxis response regulator CheY
MPVLIVWGADDKITPLSLGQTMQEEHVVPGCGMSPEIRTADRSTIPSVHAQDCGAIAERNSPGGMRWTAMVVHEAGSGTEGLDLLRAKQVDLILSDINMPSMDGLEFLRQLRAQNLAPGVPVVMITTESSEEHVKQAILAGAQGYIRKPFTAEQVKERVLPLLQAV